jgi:hypothetical protein
MSNTPDSELDRLEKLADEFGEQLHATMKEESKTDPRRPAGPVPHVEQTEMPGVLRIVGETDEWKAYCGITGREYHNRLWAKGSPVDTWAKAAYGEAVAARVAGLGLTDRQKNALTNVEG